MPKKVGLFFGNMDQNLITMLAEAEGMPLNIEPFRVGLYEPGKVGVTQRLVIGQPTPTDALKRTRYGVSATLGDCILVVRERCEGAHRIGGHDVSGQKHFGRESLRLSAARGHPVLRVLASHLFASTPGHSSRVPEGRRAQSYEQSPFAPNPPMMIRRLAKRQ